MFFDSNDLMMIPISTGLALHPEQKDQMGFMARYVPTMDADYVENVVVDTFRQIRGLKTNEIANFRVTTMKREAQGFNLVMAAISGVAGGMLCLSIVVGGVGIMNIMLVTVTERTREIGIRKTVGAKRSHILAQFLIEAALLCLFGGAVGLMLGYLVGMTASKLLFNHTPGVPLSAFVVAFGVPAAIAIMFGYYPAAKASRLDPIEALRHE
jgi:putative ABC transport system permease protein